MKVIHAYANGNCDVTIFDDGTKIRQTKDDEFKPEFPENIDIKVSDRCDLACPFCHENSTENGKVAKFNQEFLWSLRKGTELAIGGGNIFENDDIYNFLGFCKRREIIANITVNQGHAYYVSQSNGRIYHSPLELLVKRKWVNGVGISFNGDADGLNAFYAYANEPETYMGSPKRMDTSNFVIHVINGVQSFEDLKAIASTDRKILILGYKDVRRGVEFRTQMDAQIKANQQSIYDNMEEIFKLFKVVSFDNLAIEQLDMKRFFTDEQWQEFYMGDDGGFTQYIDLCEEKFSMNSCDTTHRFDLLPTIDEMFKVVQQRREELRQNNKEDEQ